MVVIQLVKKFPNIFGKEKSHDRIHIVILQAFVTYLVRNTKYKLLNKVKVM